MVEAGHGDGGASGAIPTAQPWQRTVRRPVPDPELTVGILIDASGSMTDFAKPMSSAAWIVAQAATRAGATTATLAYGDRITVLIPPGRRPVKVRDMRADAGTERFVEACAEADRLLYLSTPVPHGCSSSSPTATTSTPTKAKPPSPDSTTPAAPSCGSHQPTKAGHPGCTSHHRHHRRRPHHLHQPHRPSSHRRPDQGLSPRPLRGPGHPGKRDPAPDTSCREPTLTLGP
ncbi:hypothetical protein MCAG_05088 [Micromonospora sp. ATCC 39149]|nr:hypothetical protein MCAG_05088 [Micromonospora sp. ATCC 39149]